MGSSPGTVTSLMRMWVSTHSYLGHCGRKLTSLTQGLILPPLDSLEVVQNLTPRESEVYVRGYHSKKDPVPEDDERKQLILKAIGR